MARLGRRGRFEGEVTRGADNILLDDFITSGAELRDLRDYISSKGGYVVMITTFGHGSFGKLSDIRIDSDYESKLREAGITDQDLRKYGIASEIGCLTISEAAKLNRMVNGRTKRASSSVIERFSSLRQEHSAVPAVADEVSGTEKREQIGMAPSANNRPVMRR